MEYENGLLTQDEIVKRVEEKEFTARCIKAGVCPTCGEDLIDFEASNRWAVAFGCNNPLCPKFKRVFKWRAV